MTPSEYAANWKRYVHELKGEGIEAKSLLKELTETWKLFTIEQQKEAANLICIKHE